MALLLSDWFHFIISYLSLLCTALSPLVLCQAFYLGSYASNLFLLVSFCLSIVINIIMFWYQSLCWLLAWYFSYQACYFPWEILQIYSILFHFISILSYGYLFLSSNIISLHSAFVSCFLHQDSWHLLFYFKLYLWNPASLPLCWCFIFL